MSIFEFENYKLFVRQKIKTFPRRGRGQLLRIAGLLNIHTSMVTHIFKGDSNLSVEQALKLAEYFALNSLETEYFITLVHLARATNKQSRDYFDRQLDTLRSRALNLSERLQAAKNLDEKDQAIFYSAWYFSAIHLLCAIREFKSPNALAEAMDLPLPMVGRAVDFLLTRGLLVEEKGVYKIGQTRTYVSRDSHFVNKHHLNWRLKSVAQLDYVPDDELVFTHAIAVSERDFSRIREEIVRFLEIYKTISEPSPSEKICFLNIDWRRLRVKV
jgi:uncharacterized protein (TIGR02147 family)